MRQNYRKVLGPMTIPKPMRLNANTAPITSNIGLTKIYPLFEFIIGLTQVPAHFIIGLTQIFAHFKSGLTQTPAPFKFGLTQTPAQFKIGLTQIPAHFKIGLTQITG